MLNTPQPTIVVLKNMARVTAPYCLPHDDALGMWLRDYANTRSEFVPPDHLTVYNLSEALGLAMEKIVAANPAGAVELLGRLFENMPATAGLILRNVAWRLIQKPNILKLAPYIGTNVDAKYALAAVLLVKARDMTGPDLIAETTARLARRTLEEQRAHEETEHVEKIGEIGQTLIDLGFISFDKYIPKESLAAQVALRLFGEAWAVIYASNLDSYDSIVQLVLIDRPQFAGTLLRPAQSLPDEYSA